MNILYGTNILPFMKLRHIGAYAGYLSERLTNLFLMFKFTKMKTYPVIITENKYNLKNNLI